MPTKLSPLALLLGFMHIGLISVGGAAAPLRYVIVVRRRWLTDGELSEMFGVAQALPGASAANLAVMIGDRFGGALGPLWVLLGLCGPTLVIALALASFATRVSATNPRFAAGETAVTAAVAGLFISNGIRVGWGLWHADRRLARRWRSTRLAISAAAVVLVAGLHAWIPAVMIGLATTSFGVELLRRRRGTALVS